MKKSLIVAGILLAGSTLVAGDEYFVGLEVGNSSMDVTAKIPSLNRSISDDVGGGHQSIKIGKYFGENMRAGVSFFRYNEDENVDVSTQAIALDYVFNNPNSLRPYIGLSVSNFKYEQSGLIALGYDKDTLELSNTALGGHIGIIYNINKNVEFETGYRLIKTDASDDLSINGVAVNISSDDIKQWHFGLNYKF